jgi:hypothetical protein
MATGGGVVPAVYVYWSAALVALVPPEVVTVTSTVPVPVGEIAVSEVALFTVYVVAGTPAKLTAVAPVKLVPVSVTEVPIGPEVGASPVTVDCGGTVYVYWSAGLVALLPSVVTTVTFTVPVPVGDVAVSEVALFTVNEAAALVPNWTCDATVKFVPVTTTPVPAGPEAGLTPVTVGEPGPMYVNWSAATTGLVPPPVTTVMSTPPDPAGDVVVMDVGLTRVKVPTGNAPNSTAEAPAKFVPVIVTGVPPAAGPEAGLTPVTVGLGGGVPAVIATF